MILSKVRGSRALLVALGGVTLSVCGGGGGGGGTGGGPTVPIVTTPTPSTAPTPDPPLSQSCVKLAPGDPNAPCRREPPDFDVEVEDAIDRLKVRRPEIFDGETVKSIGAYYVGLIHELDGKGLCAASDGEELAVARTSGYNEQYDVLTARQEIRRGAGAYRTTCSPSVIPFSSGALPPPEAGCPLPSSREVACSRESGGRFLADVEAAVAQIQKDHPELFDPTDTPPGSDWPRVKDMAAYNQGIVSILVGKGYCAKHDGEEVAVKKGTNEFSEQYDVDYQGMYIRTGPGIYRASCYPAAF
jgi:hypothetical protein